MDRLAPALTQERETAEDRDSRRAGPAARIYRRAASTTASTTTEQAPLPPGTNGTAPGTSGYISVHREDLRDDKYESVTRTLPAALDPTTHPWKRHFPSMSSCDAKIATGAKTEIIPPKRVKPQLRESATHSGEVHLGHEHALAATGACREVDAAGGV